MNQFNSGVPITEIQDRGATLPSGGTIAVTNAGEPLRVVFQGTTPLDVTITGSISANIGNIKLSDGTNDTFYADVHFANEQVYANSHVLLVQHVDRYGKVLDQTTLTDLLNAQGTQSTAGLATTTLQQTGNSILSVMVNNEGTLATGARQDSQTAALTTILNHQGTLATAVNQTAGNAVLGASLSVLINDQGTLATSAKQDSQTAVLSSILNAQGTQSTAGLATTALQQTGNTTLVVISNNQGTLSTEATQLTGNATLSGILQALQAAGSNAGTNVEATFFNSQKTPAAGVAVNVSGYSRHTVQHVINGSVSVHTQTSLDGSNWNLESVDTVSTMLRLTGPTKFVRANYVSGNGTLTSLLNSIRDGGGGGSANGIGPAENTFSGILTANLGDTYTLPTNNANSIGVHIDPPAGAALIFEGSWNNISWNDMTLRQMGGHGYSTTTEEHEDWIGSVATFRFWRVRVTRAGSGTGSIHGRLSYAPCTLEGIEHGNMPHRIGAAAVAKAFGYTAITGNGTIWSPTNSTHRLVVTDINFTITGATSTVTFSDGSLADGKYIFTGKFKPPSNESIYIPINFALPHVFSGTQRSLCFTQTGAADVDGVVHGYESE